MQVSAGWAAGIQEIAWLPMAVVGLWFIYRIVRGWLTLSDRRPLYA